MTFLKKVHIFFVAPMVSEIVFTLTSFLVPYRAPFQVASLDSFLALRCSYRVSFRVPYQASCPFLAPSYQVSSRALVQVGQVVASIQPYNLGNQILLPAALTS